MLSVETKKLGEKKICKKLGKSLSVREKSLGRHKRVCSAGHQKRKSKYGGKRQQKGTYRDMHYVGNFHMKTAEESDLGLVRKEKSTGGRPRRNHDEGRDG